jgi:hypothetical protein
MHTAASETIAEQVGKIVDYGKEQGEFSLTVALDSHGDYSSALIFGREASDSPMAGGASYGYGASIPEALAQIIDECRIERKTLGY